MKWYGLIILLFVFSSELISAPVKSCHKSTEGTDFWFGFMEGRNADFYKPYVEVTLSSSFTCNYRIFIGKSNGALTGQVTPNVPVKVRLDWKTVEALGSEIIQEKAIHLVSDNPLNVYALNYAMNSSEVATVFPTESIGNEYYAMCYDPHVSIQYNVIVNFIHYDKNVQGKNSEFLIVASDDSTDVSITPSVVTDSLRPAHIPFTVRLNKGEVYQVQSANLPNLKGQGDLTGSYITSSKPVALFSGSYSTTVPLSSNSAYDHLFEQMPPVQTWGRKFITVPLKIRHEDTYRILAAEDNTAVSVTARTAANVVTTNSFVLNKGNFKEFSLGHEQPSLIESDKAILLAQFSNSNSVDSAYTHGNGDPFMVIVSPVNQTRQKVGFVAYDSPAITSQFFINVVIKDDAKGKILLDGVVISFFPVTGTGYSYAQINLLKGNHYIESQDPTKGFIAYVYGFGGFEGYGYGVGYNLDVVLDVGGKLNPNGTKSLVQCYGAPPVTLDAGNSFSSYLWNTGETTPTVQVTKSGWYTVKASTSDGCDLTDSVELRVDKPIVDLGKDTTICKPNKLVLAADNIFSGYLWSTKETTPTISVARTGTYALTVADSLGCKANDTINVRIADKPKMDLSTIDTLFCGEKSAFLNISSDKGSLTVKRLSDKFIFNTTNVSVPQYGSYAFNIRATDEYSCYSDSTVNISFRDIPTVDFLVDSTLCYQNDPLVKYLGNANVGITDFSWIFKGDTIRHGIGLDTIRAPLGINQTVNDLKLTVSQFGCFNSKVINGIKIIPKFKISVVDSAGCAPYTASFVTSGAGAVTFEWDFGDGNKLTTPAASQSHTYQLAGYYPVGVKVTTNKDCVNVIHSNRSVQVNPIPAAGFEPLSSECLNVGRNELSGIVSGNPFDRYIWNLSELDPDEIIQNPNETRGPLIFDLKNKPQAGISLKLISQFGCASSPETILVKRKPDFSLNSSTNEGCSPLETLFTSTVNDLVDRLTYEWSFGDGEKGKGKVVGHLYEFPDRKYDVTLTVLSSVTGCRDSIARKEFVIVNPKPKASFTMDNSIVYNDKPTIHFQNSSVGATMYNWDFGDGQASDQKNPSHDYALTGSRKVWLEVLNEYQCSDTTSNDVLVALNQLFPPTGFSPNAPDFIDREFKLTSNGITSTGYHLRIFSRWEDLVFEAAEEIKGWDGRLRNGSFAPSGVYVWVLDYNDFLGRKHRQTGNVTLVY